MTRAEVNPKDTWRLEDIYPSDDQWEADAKRLAGSISELGKLSGTLTQNAQNLLSALNALDEAAAIAEKLYVYAHMRRDEDNANPTYQALTDRAMKLSVDLDAATSFVTPELLTLGETQLAAYREDPAFHAHSRLLAAVMRSAPHTLDTKGEKLLALTGEMAQSADTIFTMLSDVDMRFGEVTDETGKKVPLTHGNYIAFMENENRAIRKDAFTQMYGAYKQYINTISATYASSVRKDLFYARARNYPNAVEMSLHPNEIPFEVYSSLLQSVHEHLPAMHEYMRLRKTALGVDELHMYDLYTPIVPKFEMDIAYAEACSMVQKALAPLGAEYGRDLAQAFENRWIDVYETEGKTSGAYSWGTYGVHPYVLLNHQPNLDGVFTLAHEMGHALHTLYSNQAQPHALANYPLFLAEVASTTNEALLMRYLLDTLPDTAAQRYLLNHQLEQYRTTLFRQTMFAEFELWAYDQEEKGESLTPQSLCQEYAALNQRYYGPSVIADEEIAYEWARIPHFYRSFYVYQYATGFSAAMALSEGILSGDAKALSAYFDFLHAGDAHPPLTTLQQAGADMSTPSTVNRCLDAFDATLEKLKVLGVGLV